MIAPLPLDSHTQFLMFARISKNLQEFRRKAIPQETRSNCYISEECWRKFLLVPLKSRLLTKLEKLSRKVVPPNRWTYKGNPEGIIPCWNRFWWNPSTILRNKIFFKNWEEFRKKHIPLGISESPYDAVQFWRRSLIMNSKRTILRWFLRNYGWT